MRVYEEVGVFHDGGDLLLTVPTADLEKYNIVGTSHMASRRDYVLRGQDNLLAETIESGLKRLLRKVHLASLRNVATRAWPRQRSSLGPSIEVLCNE